MKKRTGETIKDLMLGDTSKTASQQTSKAVKQYTVKATYYIKEPSLIKELKLLSVEKERDLSGLVTEAIRDLIKKYRQ